MISSEWSAWQEATTWQEADGARTLLPSGWTAWQEALTWAEAPENALPSAWSAWQEATTRQEQHHPWRLITSDGPVLLIPHVVTA